MPIPTEAGVRASVALLVADRGYDLEDVRVDRAGRHSVVRVVVDADRGIGLAELATLSTELSAVLDAADSADTGAYTLEVTTPGVDRPLTAERHWRRARGRRARVRIGAATVEGRIGALANGSVDLVVRDKSGPTVRRVSLADIDEAVVQIEFAAPDPRELALVGGVTPGRPAPGEPDESSTTEGSAS